MILKRTSLNYSVTHYMERQWKMYEIEYKIKENTEDNNEKITKQRSKLNFMGTHNFYTNDVSYTYKQNEVVMDTPIYLGLAMLELSKLIVYET